MVSAVAFVVSVEQPMPPTHNARESLQGKAKDVLDVLYDTPSADPKYGTNELSALIAKCLNKRCAELEQKLEKLVPPGASYALYVSNGHETHPILLKGKPRGEAVTASRTFQPEWSSTFLATATATIGPADALLTYALPIFHSTPVAPGGSQIFVKVSGTRVSDGSDYVLVASASTSAHDAVNDPDAVAASLYFIDSAGNPLPVHNLTGTTLLPQRMTLRLAETQNAWIPAGAEVTLHTPRGWTASASSNGVWTVLENAVDKNGSYVGSALRARLDQPLRAGVADLPFDITYHGDVLDWYPLTAIMSKGANAMASVILRGEVHAAEPALATPLLHMSVPAPMGSGAETTWTLSAHIPVNDSEGPNQTNRLVRVHTVELIEMEGNRIFGSAVAASPSERMGGTWVSSGDSLVWRGNVEMDVHRPLNLTFRVAASGTAGPSDLRSHFVPPVTFDDWTGRLVGRTGWGFHRQAILPADDTYAGYNSSAGVVSKPHWLNSSGVYRQTELPGHIQYSVSLAGAVQDALYGSYVLAEERSVPIGGEVVISANVQSVLFALADAGQRAGVAVRFYPPWSGDDREPVWYEPNLDQGLLSGEVSQMVVLDVNGDGVPDPIVGTTNGRVMAFNGLTGQRLQGNAFTVPISQLSNVQQAVPKVTALETIRLYDQDHIVVGTDKNSDGLFVLDKNFGIKWRYIVTGDVLAIDVSTDFNGDGQPEIVVARAHEIGTSKDAVVYVLHAPPTPGPLVPLPGKSPPEHDSAALAMTLGTPTTILAQSNGGPRGGWQRVVVPIQTNFEPGISVTYGPDGASLQEGPSSTPRAGVQGVNELGETTGTLFGAPASVLRDYDYDGDAVRDVLLGGASGYVIMANGTVLTQPIYSYILIGLPEILDADTRSTAESYAIAADGTVFWTDDAWLTAHYPTNMAPGGKAISSPSRNEYWVVGTLNQVWRSAPTVDASSDPMTGNWPSGRDLLPVVLDARRAGVPYDFVQNVHEFRDVHFRGGVGYIVGSACALAILCGEPILLKTTDGGDTWSVLSSADGTLTNRHGQTLNKNLTSVEIVTYGDSWTGWAVGDGGLIARNLTGGAAWRELPTDFTYNLRDIACLPGDPDTCWVVGDAGAAFVTFDARAATPTWHNRTGSHGLPTDRPLYSVGFPEDTRGYIGSRNMVLGSFHGSSWTALPLNYVENSGYVVSTAGDGGGFVLGGSPANGRIWLLHDYHTQSQAQTVSFQSRFPPGARIFSAEILDGDITFGQQEILVNVTTNGGGDWQTIGPLGPPVGVTSILKDTRKPLPAWTAWTDPQETGSDFRVRIVFNTTSDKTILTPHVRALTLRVHYLAYDGETVTAGHEDISLDFTSQAQLDKERTTADWNVTLQQLRQPLVQEFWTRNVSGEVLDIRTGYNVIGDEREDIWVATGDTLAENSPDYAIYAGTDPNRLMERHNRVYLLDGRNGHPHAISPWLEGEVRHIRLVNSDSDPEPDILFAATWNTTGTLQARGKLYALDPLTLQKLWEHDLLRQVPADMEAALLPGNEPIAFVGAARPTPEAPAPSLWGIPHTPPREKWKVIPDDLGKYLIRKEVEPTWLYGPHVVEIAVEWEETVTEAQVNVNLGAIPDALPPAPDQPDGVSTPTGMTVLRSARFYDHFMVTPPEAVTATNPVYTARLLLWLDDWG